LSHGALTAPKRTSAARWIGFTSSRFVARAEMRDESRTKIIEISNEIVGVTGGVGVSCARDESTEVGERCHIGAL
jgi:hypothetical protein